MLRTLTIPRMKWVGAAVTALVLVATVSSWSLAAPAYNWKLASVLPAAHPVHKALVSFADRVAEKTGGAIKITVFPAGQLGQEKD